MDSGKGDQRRTVDGDAEPGGDGCPGMARTAEHADAAGAAHRGQIDRGDQSQDREAA